VNGRRAERAYALLLRAYPREFRRAYGRDMALAFRDLMRNDGASPIGFWIRIVADVARTAPLLRAEAMRARWSATIRPKERPMKTMGVLAVLVGLLQIVNAGVELNAGGTVGWPALVVEMAIVMSVLLVIAGVALLARASSAPALSKVAALCWLAVVVLVKAVHPWMSVFATLLAVVFPVVLLAYVWIGRKSSFLVS
jgi:hypothetical protein